MKARTIHIQVAILLLIFVTSIGNTYAQGGPPSCLVTGTQYFNAQAETRDVNLPSGCNGTSLVAVENSSWFSAVVISGNRVRITVQADSGPERQGNIVFETTSGSTAGGMSIIQNDGVQPPDPCVVSGFSGSNVAQAGETKNYTLSYSATCPSNVAYTFKQIINNDQEVDLPGWVIPTQNVANKTVSLQFQANEQTSSRTIVIVGKRQDGGTPGIGGSFTQSCEKDWYLDSDDDDFRDPGSTVVKDCATTKPGYTRMTTVDNCPNDNNAGNVLVTWYEDTDGDDYKDDGGQVITQCSQPAGNWTSTPKPGTDGCPTQYYATNGGCNPNCGITLASDELVFEEAGGTQYINFSLTNPGLCTSYDITFDNVPTWLTVTENSGTIRVDCQAWPDFREQLGIQVRITGGTPKGFKVIQNPEPVIPDPQDCGIQPIADITLDSFADSKSRTVVFDPVECSGYSIIIEDPLGQPLDWLTITPSGYTFDFSAADNETGSPLTAVLVVKVYDDAQSAYFPIGSSFSVTQPSCRSTWYPDSDNDGFGDAFALGWERCGDPDDDAGDDPNTHWVDNNNDICPEIIGTDQGCPTGQVPENYNTITVRGFDIDNTLKGASKSYFDALGKSKQTQTLDVLTNRIWASETFYDSEGKEALRTLGAPTELADFGFKDNFTLNGSGSPYQTSDFELDPENPATVATTLNSLGWYYSEQNTDTFHEGNSYQDITDRPYSRFVYSNLIPGMILRAVGGNKVDTDEDGQITATDAWPQTYTFSMRASDELSQTDAFGDVNYDNYQISKTVFRDVHGVENVVFIDSDGRTLAAARSGGPSARTMQISIEEQGYVDIHVPAGSNMGFTVNTGGNAITTYNLHTETTVTPSNGLPNGFYRVAVDDPDDYQSGTASVSYQENYYDYSLNEYDLTGRLSASYQPLNKLRTDYTYNALGQLIRVDSPDEGISEFKYRKDGQIRYSQNSVQATANEVSYTEYDGYGRPVESGVLANVDFSTLLADDPLPTATKSETSFTEYDVPLNTLSCSSPLCVSIIALGGQHFLSGNVSRTQNDQNTTYYSYDQYGRVAWLVQDISGLGVKTVEYEYHPVTGLVERVLFQKGVSGEQFIHRYGYDVQDRLILVETSTDDLQYVTQAQYEYYETGALKRTELAGGVQGVDYVYNLAGQLKSLNHPSLAGANDPGGNTNDLFGMQLDYHNNDYQRPLGNITAATYGTDQLNGNIKGIRWNNYQGNNEAPVAYSYSYDRNNWLTDAHFGQYGDGSNSNILPNEEDTGTYTNTDGPIVIQGTSSVTLRPNFHAQQGSDVTVRIAVGEGFNPLADGDYNVTGIGYDANGNIQTLTRNKHNADDGASMDDLTYVYRTDKPNQLLRVEDGAGDVVGAEDIGTQTGNNYEYNAIGQLTRNNSEGISYFYNVSGLVTEIQKANKPVLKLYYNDRNHRIKKERFQSDGMSVGETTCYVRDVAGQVLGIYTENTSMPLALRETPVYGQDRIGIYKHEDGGTDVTYYELKDHLGNVRVLFTKNGTDALGESYTDYYPFGSPMPGRNIVGDYRYAYQGQEKDPETGMEAFELRLWDSRIGRWLTTDPYGQYASPYLGMGNNPISRIDPDGGMDCPDGCPEYRGDGVAVGDVVNALDGVDVFGVDKSPNKFQLNLRSDLGRTSRNISATLLTADLISTKDVFKIKFQPQVSSINLETGLLGNRAGGTVYNKFGLQASKVANVAKPIIRYGLRTVQGASVVYDGYLLETGQITQERFNFRTIGTGSSILTASLVSTPAGFLVGSTFMMAEMTHDSYHDMTDPDRNPNTIHSIGEARLNAGWAIDNLEQGLLEGFDY